ncbi:Pycsar system effector family protein [Allorhizocola rhizosphaerae]|uniref:Pycsar system effector family protein n=1 Tax=Allorhizocola rhizosphaerae TaxID=1872709 RepID=UPI000E3BD79A|nr:Pycsar system effector family protein [Allorhizocola rhizosphaerae]
MTADSPWKVLTLVNEWIRHAEAKAAAVLAGAGVAGALVYQLVRDEAARSVPFTVIAVLASALVVCSGLAASVALWPRLAQPGRPASLIYFQHIAHGHHTAEDYSGALESELASDGLFAEVAEQIFSNARVAREKFRWTRLALMSLLPAIVLIGLMALLSVPV